MQELALEGHVQEHMDTSSLPIQKNKKHTEVS